MSILIIEDDLRGKKITQLLQNHMDFMVSQSPAESVHALDLDKLRVPEITFWSAWDENNPQCLLGCMALKMLSSNHAEIKSMHVTEASRGRGLSKVLCQFVIDEAKKRKCTRLSLETGTGDAFEPAHRLYKSFGFEICSPFGDYFMDMNSQCMTLYFEG
jgi:putative acetyltransferase